MRLLNILVIAALIVAASVVYKIKFDSTLQAEKVAKLRGQIRAERNAIASLHAEWAKLSTPARIQGLAERHLKLQPVKPTQFSDLEHLPDRPPQVAPPANDDLIGAMLADPNVTGSVPPAAPPDR
jgi:cell division protein FtsL